MATAAPSKTRFLTDDERDAVLRAARIEVETDGAKNVIATADRLRSKGHDAEVHGRIKQANRLYDAAHLYRFVGQGA